MPEGCSASVCLGLDLRVCVSTCVCKTLCTSVHVSVHVSAHGYRSTCLCEHVPLVCVYASVCAGCLYLSLGFCYTCQRLQPPWVFLSSF